MHFSPLVRTPGKCVAVADFDGDGDMDIFIGGRVSLGTFPEPPRSYILRNDHGNLQILHKLFARHWKIQGLLMQQFGLILIMIISQILSLQATGCPFAF